MADFNQALSLDGTQVILADTSDTDQMNNEQKEDTGYVNSNGPDAEKTVQVAPQWGGDAPDGGSYRMGCSPWTFSVVLFVVLVG